MNPTNAGNASDPNPARRSSRWTDAATMPMAALARTSKAGGSGGSSKTWRWIAIAVVAVLVLALLGGAIDGIATVVNNNAINAAHTTEQRDQAALDHALGVAQTQFHTPPARLASIVTAEQRASAGTTNSVASYEKTSSTMRALTQRVNALIATTPDQAKTWTQDDLNKLNNGVNTISQDGFIEATGFQQRLQQAQDQFSNASSTPQYFAADSFTLDQLAAVTSFEPTYQRLQDFSALVQSETQLLNGPTAAQNNDLQCAQGLSDQFWLDDTAVQVTPSGSNLITTPEMSWPDSDLELFRAATTGGDFAALNTLLTSQTQQILANETSMSPALAITLLQQEQADIKLVQQQKQDATSFQQAYAQDQRQQQAISASASPVKYLTFVNTIRQHISAMALPLIQAKTNSDLATLQNLVNQGQALKTVDPANGVGYPDAYEYADPGTGIGDVTQRLAAAQTVDDYQAVDSEILMFTANIQAMIKNLNDPTAWNQPHATDMQLMQHYGVTSQNVVVVSLREQAARFYQNGKLVKAVQVTTGAPDLPSVPGIHCVFLMQTNTVFTSPDPPGSPNYYLPTPIHFAVYYSYYGYTMHDAWWRSWFGKYSNLPHYDPAAFNGGSHGCVNFDYTNGDAQYMYNFVSMGSPIIIY